MGRRKVSQGWLCQKRRCSQLSCMTQGTPELQFTAAMERNFVEAKLQNTPIKCLVDSGASISCISQHQLQQLQYNGEIQDSSITSAVGVCGEVHPVLGEIMLEVTFGHITVKQKFRVFETLHSKVIFGLDFLQENKIRTDFENMTLTIPLPGKNLNYISESGSADHVTVSTIRDQRTFTTMAETVNHIILEPHSETILPVKIPNYSPGATVILEPSHTLQSKFSVAGGRTVTYLDDNQIGIYRVLNPTNLPVYLKCNLQIAAAQPVNFEDVHCLQQQEPAFLFSLSENNKQFDEDYESILSDIGIELDSCDLDSVQRQQLCKFLAQNRNIFAKDLSELGKTNMHYHTIHTKGDKVVSSAPYRQSPQMRAELERQLDEMEAHGIIEESTSPFHSPVVLVKKRNNEYRFCVDFRALNRITEPMSFTIPHMSDILDTLADAKPEIYSTLDLRSGFWQVPLDPATKHKSAFITHKGVYEFNRLAFGMMNSPMTFQCLMTKVLRNLNFKVALVYIDDVLIFSKNFQEHLQHLHLVFSSLRSANLKLHPSKCIFAKKEVKYLGHIISKHGVRVNPENTEKVKTFPVPQNTKQVKSFLGMANYYRKFVKDFAQIASPLTSLLKKNVKFQWTLSCQKAYDTLKNALVTAPILAFPDFDKPFILSTDASEYSMGYVLSQIQNGREHAIAYGGRSLHGAELKWHITDKEALALVEGIQHFKHYLANQEFTVFTDNVSVKYLQKIRDCQGRLGRWSLLLQGYNFKIIHRDGSKNPADCLSRQQHDNSTPTDSPDLGEHLYYVNHKEHTETVLVYPGEVEEHVIASLQERPSPELVLQNMANLQQQCPDFQGIYEYKLNQELPNDPAIARTIVAESYNFELEDGILKHFYSKRCKKVPKQERLVKQVAVPRILRDDVLRSYHDCILGGGHQGFERTYAALRNKYFWPSMYDDIKRYVQTCETCQQSKRNYGAKRPPLKPQISDDIFGRWHMDILSGLPTTPNKHKHILLVVDSYSKWCEAFPLRTQEASEVARVLYKEIITRYGAPRTLISDRGRNFVSNLVKALSEMFQITRHLTSSYHPQTNGSVERMNSVILQAIRCYAKGQQDDWDDLLLPGILMAYRATPATQSTDFSPYFMLYGREMCLPIDSSLVPKEHLAQDQKIFLGRILQNLERTRKIASENIKLAQERNKQRYDQTAKEPDFFPTQRVWLYCTKVPVGNAPKLHRQWVGPYYITMVNRQNHTYKIRNCANNKEVKSLVSAHRLKPYHDPLTRPTNPPPEHANDDAQLDPDELDQNIGRPTVQPARQNAPAVPSQANNPPRVQNRPPRQNRRQNKRPQQHNQQPHQHNQPPQQQNQQPQQRNQLQQNQPLQHNQPLQQHSRQPQRPNQQQSNWRPQKQSQKTQPDQQIQRNNHLNQPRNPPIADTRPSCRDCKRGSCTPFKEDMIDRLLASNRGNGTLYYKVKFSTGNTEWHFPCKIPSHLVRQFHADRTMSGKKRKRPLHQTKHKFFNKQDPQPQEEKSSQSNNSQTSSVNVLSGTTFNCKEELRAIRMMNGRAYFLVQTGSSDPKWKPLTSASSHACKFISSVSKQLDEEILQNDIQHLRNQRLKIPEQNCELWQMVTGHKIHEVQFSRHSEPQYLMSFANPYVPPKWVPFNDVPFGLVTFLLEDLKSEYCEELDIPQ